eukprot:4747344-Pleurochrysis_carterae.AAC.3
MAATPFASTSGCLSATRRSRMSCAGVRAMHSRTRYTSANCSSKYAFTSAKSALSSPLCSIASSVANADQ